MTKFSDLKLDPKVLKAVAEAGYETPTPIQAGAIPPALEGRDVLGIAQTGTGKTASFTLPMITLLGRGRARARMPRSLVLCPTRELAAQVAENFDIYASQTRLTKALLIGGVSFAEQDKLIDRGVDVLIATPGRLLDHFERGKLLLTGVQIMVVDEADRMLDMGFIPDIERIFQLTPFTRQTLFFSATMAPEIERITNTFLHTPERIEVARQATASETITQRLVEITPTRRDLASKQKRELLRALIDAEGPETEQGGLKNAIIFCNRKTDVDIVAKSLAKHGYDAAPIHGDLDQSHRTRTLESFRDGRLKLLIASDVAARGLDIPAVSHVFNFDLPSHAEDYVHRIGRTGRAGRLGTAISIGTPADDKYLSAIESLLKQSLPRGTVPEGFTISEDGGRVRDGGRSSGRDRDDNRRGGRDRRGRGRGEDERPQEARKPEARDDRRRGGEVESTPRSDEQPANQGRAEQPREQDRNQDRGRDRGRDQDRRTRNRGNDHRGPVVMGLGDHVPQFMLVELRSADFPLREDASDEAEAEAPLPAANETAPEAPEKARKERPARSKPRSRRRSAAAPDEAEAAAVTETAPDAAADLAVADLAAGDAATMVPTGEAQPQDAPPAERAETDKPAAKPKRSRRKKADDAAAEPEKPTEAEAEKPKRSRRKKAEPAEAEASENAPAKTPAPRRSRRNKAETADDAPTASETADRADAEA